VAKDTNSFGNQAKRVGDKLSSLAAPAKAALQRGAAMRKARTTPKPTPEAPMRVMGKTKAETSANLDAAKAKRSSAPMAPSLKATAQGQAEVSMAKGAQAKMMATPAMPEKATAPKPAATKSAKTGAAYPEYKKDSSEAKSFRAAFDAARKAGKPTFPWNGRSYNTKLK
jgi:hypothetical protein